MATTADRTVYWLPRLLSIAFILFLSLFSLDVFGEGYGFWNTLLALTKEDVAFGLHAPREPSHRTNLPPRGPVSQDGLLRLRRILRSGIATPSVRASI